MNDPALDVGDRAAGIALVPLPIEVLGGAAELESFCACASIYLPSGMPPVFVTVTEIRRFL
jgi:hypothetical protein